MKLSTFIFHVESSKVKDFRELVGSYFKRYYPNAQKKGTLTISDSRLVVATYDMEWLWSEVSCFIDCVLRKASEKAIIVVCESVSF